MDVNEIELKVTDSFFFRRFEKIDWKQIASVNLDQLKDKSNFNWSVIEENIGNILYCHLQSEFDSSCLDVNLCKLFQLAQVSIEYLLKIRQQLLTEVKCLQEKNENSQTKLNAALKSKEETEKKYKELKRDSKKSSHQLYYRCPSCPKTFLNGDFLRGHWQRRHQHTFPVTQNIDGVLDSEKLMVDSIIHKMDQSNVSMQEFVAQEIEKVRQEFEKGGGTTNKMNSFSMSENDTNKPEKRSVETQVSVIHHSIGTCTDEIHSLSIGTNTESVRDASIAKSAVGSIMNVNGVTLQRSKPDLSSDEAYDKEESDMESLVKKEIPPIDANLKNNFKTLIRNALKDRMRMLGIEDNRSYSSSKTKRILQQIRSTSTGNAEFQNLRQHFKTVLHKQLINDGKKSCREISNQPSVRKRLFLPTYPATAEKMETPKKHSVRPPVPAPRTRTELHNVNSQFMARDGEASIIPNPKSSNQSTTPPIAERSINVAATTPPIEKQTNSSADEDSFSLSSLDAILSELKRPQRHTPAGKSVQWKNPVEQAVRIENSWDS